MKFCIKIVAYLILLFIFIEASEEVVISNEKVIDNTLFKEIIYKDGIRKKVKIDLDTKKVLSIKKDKVNLNNFNNSQIKLNTKVKNIKKTKSSKINIGSIN